jgi:hypothetical protein
MRLTAIALGDDGGGVLVPGPANFVLSLYKAVPNADPIVYDTKTVAVNLVLPVPTIADLTLASNYVELEGDDASYSAAFDNPGAARSDVIIQGYVRQGGAWRGALGTGVRCGGDGAAGELPTGRCTVSYFYVARNAPAAGSGTLVPGPATFELQLIDRDTNGETLLDTRSVPITIVANTPSIVSLSLNPTSVAIGSSTRYQAVVYNPGSTTLTSVTLQGSIVQGSVESPAGGTTVTCGNKGGFIPGACAESFTVNPSNGQGYGLLVPGAAQFVLTLYLNGVLDTKSVPITLTAP